jgi:acetyl/propionyl-CoA carboxylase alpha subunit
MDTAMIRKVLIANRGEIAIRISHTLREMGIVTAGVFTEADAQALHTRQMDEAHRIESYLDAEEITRVAQACGATAVHSGYGFLSESPSLSAACEKSGLIFIGPKTETIRLMGDKLQSKRLMQSAGVTVVPAWESSPPPSEYPVLVKAVGGGGGKGMRLVLQPSDLAEAMASAAREAGKAFNDDRVFVEKYVSNPRHIEFQIIGDSLGSFLHVFERECSIQRRHQKIVEETPSTALNPELRARMGATAVAAAEAVEYRGVGTVEFILDPTDRFFFLEMNTRLQVEHPVTEMTTGIDLVREQVRIADGQPVSFKQSDLRQTGHSIECRIYAEAPEEDFRPATGRIEVFRPPNGPGIRLDSGVEEGSAVTYHYDPLLAKLIVWAPSRNAAIDRMKRALGDFVLLGVRNNIDFLRRVISSREFGSGSLDTHFLERNPELREPPAGVIPVEALLAASLEFGQASAKPAANGAAPPFSDVWASGSWRNS